MSGTWSDKDHAKLVALVARGLTAGEIGERIGRSRNSVIGRCHRHNLKLGRKRDPFAAFDFWHENVSTTALQREIIDEIEASKSTVHCAFPGCRATRQPGRDRCAEHISAGIQMPTARRYVEGDFVYE